MLHTFSLLALLLWNGRGMPHSQFALGPQQSNRQNLAPQDGWHKECPPGNWLVFNSYYNELKTSQNVLQHQPHQNSWQSDFGLLNSAYRKRGETFSCGWSPGGSGSFSQADAEGAPHILLGNLGHVWAQNPWVNEVLHPNIVILSSVDFWVRKCVK